MDNTNNNVFNARWIPVTEQLPELYSTVLVTFDRVDDEEDEIVDTLFYTGDNFNNIGFHQSQNVIAWMPKPQPYQADFPMNPPEN